MGAARAISETQNESGLESRVRSTSYLEVCRVVVDPEPTSEHRVLLVLEQREQACAQAPLRLVRAIRRQMSPQAARHLAQLLELAAARAERESAEVARG